MLLQCPEPWSLSETPYTGLLGAQPISPSDPHPGSSLLTVFCPYTILALGNTVLRGLVPSLSPNSQSLEDLSHTEYPDLDKSQWDLFTMEDPQQSSPQNPYLTMCVGGCSQ